MKHRTAIVAALAYIFGFATLYIAWFGLGTIGNMLSDGGHEMSRKTSPDGVLDAVVIEDDPGAMSSFIYYLYLVPKGSKVSSSSSESYIVNTSEGDELMVNWQGSHFLEVDIGNAHVKWFANLWYSKKLPDYYVELTLTKAPGKSYLRSNGRLRRSAP